MVYSEAPQIDVLSYDRLEKEFLGSKFESQFIAEARAALSHELGLTAFIGSDYFPGGTGHYDRLKYLSKAMRIYTGNPDRNGIVPADNEWVSACYNYISQQAAGMPNVRRTRHLYLDLASIANTMWQVNSWYAVNKQTNGINFSAPTELADTWVGMAVSAAERAVVLSVKERDYLDDYNSRIALFKIGMRGIKITEPRFENRQADKTDYDRLNFFFSLVSENIIPAYHISLLYGAGIESGRVDLPEGMRFVQRSAVEKFKKAKRFMADNIWAAAKKSISCANLFTDRLNSISAANQAITTRSGFLDYYRGLLVCAAAYTRISAILEAEYLQGQNIALMCYEGEGNSPEFVADLHWELDKNIEDFGASARGGNELFLNNASLAAKKPYIDNPLEQEILSLEETTSRILGGQVRLMLARRSLKVYQELNGKPPKKAAVEKDEGSSSLKKKNH